MTPVCYFGSMPPDPHTSPWICDTCHLPITTKDGVIELVNIDPEVGAMGSLPRRASDDEAEPLAKVRVGFYAYHNPTCAPFPGQEGYWLAASRAATLADWCAWMNHLFEKPGWLGRGDMERLNRWWFKNRGLDIHKFGP